MPELPEVEVVRRQLERPLLGRQIAEAWAHPSPKFVSGPDAVGSEVEALRRRGKYLIAELDCGRDLVVHLGMTGRLCFAWRADAAGAPHDSSPQTLAVRPLDGPAADVMGDAIGDVTAAGKLAERYAIGRSDPHVRAWWRLDNGEVLCLHDVRRFGRVAVCDRGDYRDLPTLAAMGPEPLDPSFDAGAFWRASRRSSLRIKTQLLNQRLVAGIGNIYADEALFLARINPSARTISKPQAGRLLAALRDVLVASIERGGSTLRDYYSLDGAGDNQKYFVCYGRAGEPCVRCGTEMRRRVLDQRSSTWCPSCQRR
ncbi:bifunctional DNA-formamidopyrimidine glycosylase/DNA-(apurinic or apyrimidinic site) lyase [Candidatus Poriferisodalis sp.]|uniref:bifunctional DNA-formamidopyrimidine glycosylase/DNA-(apurinic or apyrimidinic site) lyase n=1 Tax=Candidatus Poriferisodalis sp. TaxID=3101277 RepID=UPI003B5B74C3